MNFKKLNIRVDTSKALAELDANPQLWDAHPFRRYASVHSQMKDIWVRYNAIENIGPNFNDYHQSVWYPESELIPECKAIALDIMRYVNGTRLGGVLVTKLPPGGKIEPHIDGGWHAGFYAKFYIALQSEGGAKFCWDDDCIEAKTGEVYFFRNDKTHWVENNSSVDRIAMIVCLRMD